ncbi:MAG: leucine-rich repeat domain-containing protein [Promethearchaeota archaeon]
MQKSLSPEKICEDLENNLLSKAFAIELLFSLIDSSEDPDIRKRSVDAFKKIERKDDKIFEFIENFLLSDENPRVRSAAAKLIEHSFLAEGVESLKWSIQHDKSPIVLKTIKLIVENGKEETKILKEDLGKILEYIANHVGIVREEASFFLDLEALFAQEIDDYKLDLSTYLLFQKIKDFDISDYWLKIKDKHVVSLCLNYFNWIYFKQRPQIYSSLSKLQDPFIYLNTLKRLEPNQKPLILPKSIGSLRALKYCTLIDNSIRKLPPEICSLESLEYLDLSWNQLTDFPDGIFNLEKLEYLNLSHNNLDKIPLKLDNLKNLRELKLNGNNVKEIPSSLEQFTKSLSKFKI